MESFFFNTTNAQSKQFYENYIKKNQEPSPQDLLKYLYSPEQNLLNTIQQQQKPNNTPKISLIYDYKYPYKFDNINDTQNTKIKENKIDLFLTFDWSNTLQTQNIIIYIFSEDFFTLFEQIQLGDYFDNISTVQIILHNSNIKITLQFINIINKLFLTFQRDQISFILQYNDQKLLKMRYSYEYNTKKKKPQYSFYLPYFSLENDEKDQNFHTLFTHFLKNAYQITLGKKYYLYHNAENLENSKVIYSEKGYENLNKIIQSLQNYKNLSKITLNLSNYSKLLPVHIESIKKLLENSTLLTDISLQFDNLYEYPYLNNSILENLINFDPKNRKMECISIETGNQQFKISQKSQLSNKKNKNNQLYKISYHNFKQQTYNSLINQFKRFKINPNNNNNNNNNKNLPSKQDLIDKNEYNLQFQKYTAPSLTPKQFQAILDLLKKNYYPFSELNLNLNSENLFDNQDLFINFFQILSQTIQNNYNTNLKKFTLNLQISSQHLQQQQIKAQFLNFTDMINEKGINLKGSITIFHPIYQIAYEKNKDLLIDIQGSQQKKIPYISPNIELFPNIKDLTIQSNEPVKDLQMWSLFQSFKAENTQNLQNLHLILKDCSQLSGEFFLDFSSFIKKSGPTLENLKIKLKNNKQITQQSIKTFSKSFRNLQNLKKLNLKLSNFSHFSFHSLSILINSLSQNQEKNISLKKFKLKTNYPGDILTLNQSLASLASNALNLQSLILYLPAQKTEFFNLHPKNFFPAHLNFETLNTLTISSSQCLIFFQKYQKKITDWKQVKSNIYLKLRGSYTDFQSTAELMFLYLGSLQDYLGRLSFKFFDYVNYNQIYNDDEYEYEHEEERSELFLKHSSKIPQGFYRMNQVENQNCQGILFQAIGAVLSSMKNLQYLSMKDYYDLKDRFSIEITDQFQHNFAKIHSQNLKEVKIQTNFFRFLYIRKDDDNNEQNVVYFQDFISENIRESMGIWSQFGWADSVQKRQFDCFEGLTANFNFLLNILKKNINKISLDLFSEDLYGDIYNVLEQVIILIGNSLNKIHFYFPNDYSFESKTFEPIAAMNLKYREIRFDLFNNLEDYEEFQQKCPQLSQVFKSFQLQKDQKKESIQQTQLFIKTIKRELKLEDHILSDIILNSFTTSNNNKKK